MKSRNKPPQKMVDPITGKRSDAPNAITYDAFRSRRKVDPKTGQPSNARDAITYNTFKARKKVDPETGEPSNAPNAINYNTFKAKKKVDPVTGKPSDAPNAIPYDTFLSRKKVDPVTGEPSNAPNAIAKSVFNNRKKVDPVTGQPSNAPNAITYNAFRLRRKVDPETGEPSNAPDAITYNAFRSRRKVDPKTGQPSNAPNAIAKSVFNDRKKVDPVTGQPSNAPNAIAYAAFIARMRKIKNKTTNADSSEVHQIITDLIDSRVTNENQPVPNHLLSTQDNQVAPLADLSAENNQDDRSVDLLDAMDIDSEGDGSIKDRTTLTDLPAPQIKIEPEDSRVNNENQPVLQLDHENFKKVARILRGRSKASDNCVYLVQAFIDYLRTGKMPTQPAPTDSATLEHLTFVWNSEHIPVGVKLEPGVTHPSAQVPTVETIMLSHIDRNTTFGMNTPYGEIPREVNGKIDLTIPPIYDLDRSMQKSVLYTELNAALKNEAESNGGVSFGMVSMAPCGEFIASLWHCIVYFATPHEVVYIDCQQNQKNQVFENLEDNFVFVGNRQHISKDMFGNMVFYIPLGPILANNLTREKTTSVTGKRKRDTETENNKTKRQRLSAPEEPLNLDAAVARAPSMFGSNHLFFNQDNPMHWLTENPKQNDRSVDVVDAMDIDSEVVTKAYPAQDTSVTTYGMFVDTHDQRNHTNLYDPTQHGKYLLG